MSSIAIELDSRPLVSDLLAKHGSEIEDVKTMIENDDLYKANASRYDDIWILRFVLSHKKNAASAGKAALSAMKFREENELNDLGDIRHMIPCLADPDDVLDRPIAQPLARLHSFSLTEDSMQYYFPDESRGVAMFVIPSKVDMKSVASELSGEDVSNAFLCINEILYQIHDEVTRRTGRLTKLVRVFDFSGLTFKKFSISFAKKYAAASHFSENFYPQLLGAIFVVNMPGWFVKFLAMFRPLLPQRVVEKVNIIAQTDKMKPEDLGHYSKFISEENLPERYGGKNGEWPLPSPRGRFSSKATKQEE